jgi:hypothetical protein
MLKRRDLALLCALVLPGGVAFGQNLLDGDPNSPTFNNPSFERPDVAEVQPTADKWTLGGPTTLVDVPGIPFPVPLQAGCGVFENPATTAGGRIEGANGSQLAYIFSHTQADVNTNQRVDHSFTQVLPTTFVLGNQYQLQIGFANAQAVAGTDAELKFALFDASNPSTDLVFDTLSSADLNGTSLTDFAIVTTPVTGDAAGHQIGIRIMTHTDVGSSSAQGQFDFDNVRLTIVPEPGGVALCAVAAGLFMRRGRRRQ